MSYIIMTTPPGKSTK